MTTLNESSIPNIRKTEQFDEFLKIVGKEPLSHWLDIARVLGVDKDTITEWRKNPLARQAVIHGIRIAMKNMEKAGKNDWRMWATKLKMLGIGKEWPEEFETIQSEGPILYLPYKAPD